MSVEDGRAADGAAGTALRVPPADARDAAGPSRRPDYRAAATSPRMLALLVAFIAIALVCGRLGVWQLDRAFERGQQNETARLAAVSGAPAEPLGDVLEPQRTFPGSLVGAKVTTAGSFEGDTLLVPGRAHEGAAGWLVLDAFRVTETGALLPVVRGWVPEPAAPVPPTSGPVRLEGFLQAGEAADPTPVREGQIGAVSTGQLVNLWGGPMYTGYLVLSEPIDEPTDPGIAVLRPPALPGAGLDVQNLAYALQWWIFGGFAVLLWARFVRDEARALAEEDEESEAVPEV